MTPFTGFLSRISDPGKPIENILATLKNVNLVNYIKVFNAN
jgi:hypothetical protein